MCRMWEMCKRMPCQCNHDQGGDTMKKHWYDYLWIVSLVYLLLGFFNILFAWLGLLCFFYSTDYFRCLWNKELLQPLLWTRTAP